MKKFEYKIESWINVNLNALGAEGWEFCHMIQTGECIFKREIQEVKTLDRTPAVGKRIEYRSEGEYDAGIITRIDEQGIWVLWNSTKEELWISPKCFNNGEAKVIE